MSSKTQGYVDPDGLTTKDVKVIVTAFKAMDIEKMPVPDYELMSKIYPWKWPSNNAKSDWSRLKGKWRKMQDGLKATHSSKYGNKSNATNKTDAKFANEKSATTKTSKRTKMSAEDSKACDGEDSEDYDPEDD